MASELVRAIAKAAVGALIKGQAPTTAVGIAAVNWLIDRVPGAEQGTLAGILNQVVDALEPMAQVEYQDPQVLERASLLAKDLFDQHGLTTRELLDIGPDSSKADAMLIARGAEETGPALLTQARDAEAVKLVERDIVPRVHGVLTANFEQLEGFEKAFQGYIRDGLFDIKVKIQGLEETVSQQQPHLELIRRHLSGRAPKHRIELLSPYLAGVSFQGREAEVARLRTWLTEGPTLSLKLITGPGGAGKTRLALELCKVATQLEWDAGFLERRELVRFIERQNASTWSWPRPVLIVVDYAAGCVAPLRSWLEGLALQQGSSRPALRLLLLERYGSEEAAWWRELVIPARQSEWSIADLPDAEEPILMLPELDTVAARTLLLTDVVAQTSRLAKRTPPPLPAPGQNANVDKLIRTAENAPSPLVIAMQGLLWAYEGAFTHVLRTRQGSALELAKHEQGRISAIAAEAGVSERLAKHLVACITLLRGINASELAALIREQRTILDVEGMGAEIDKLEPALEAALPLDFSDRLDGVIPDLIGEAFVVDVLRAEQRHRQQATIASCFQLAPMPVIQSLIHVNQDFADDPTHPALGWLDTVIDAHLDASALMSLSDFLNQDELLGQGTVNLRERQHRIAARLVEILSGTKERTDEQTAQLAMSLHNLAARLSELGRREEALAAAEEAVELYRGLAQARPDAFTPDLAMSLNNLANRLSELGRREEALERAEEAVELRRGLAQARPDAFTPNLAMSLNNLANRLSELGRREEALAAAEEAVELYRGLAQARPDAFTPDLAMSLHNLAARLSELGRREEALAAAEEAVELYRGLAQARPDAFTPDLAMSLNNLAAMLSELGRREEALERAEEAVELRRGLAQARPDAFTPDLAGSLNNLANRLSELGRREEALAAAEEAVELYRGLAQARPDAFTPDLAMSLNNLAAMLSELGRREEALERAEEAVELRRGLAQARPDAFTPDLAGSLNNLANRLSELGRREEALAAAEEAVELYRGLAQARPDAFTPNLAMSLNNLAAMLSELGRREEALAAAEEAVELYRGLAQARPDAFTPDLAMSLNNLANRLSELGRREEALAAAEEAVELRRGLAQARPDAFTPDLAMSLNNLAARLSELGRREEALAAAEEAVELYRGLAQARPDAFTPNLAMSLNNLAAMLSELGRREEALERAEEAVATLRPQFLKLPASFAQWMGVMVRQYVELCELEKRSPNDELLSPIAIAFQELNRAPGAPDG